MVQKVIWMQLLLIGLISTTMISCKKESPELIEADFIYTDSTSSSIIIDSYSGTKHYTYELNVGDDLKISESRYPNYSDKLLIYCDSVKITKKSSNEIIWWYPKNVSDRNPIDLGNYRYEALSGRHHEYYFSFYDSDFSTTIK